MSSIREFGLEHDLDRLPGELPYGRRRLVGIARAIASAPSVLLLDEPAAGLDDTETSELGDLVRRLADESGMAVLLIEHDVELVLRVCDRIVVLDFGRKIAEGTPARDPQRPGGHRRVPGRGDADADGEPLVSELATEETVVTRDRGPLLECRGLAAGYGGIAVVRDLDLRVEPGEVVALIGPNGAGKTTTLLTLAGELPSIAGEVVFHGVSTKAPLFRRGRRGMGFVTEERSVFMQLSTEENLRVAGVAKADSGRALPGARTAHGPDRGPAVGRGAADADARPGGGSRSQPAPRRRALARPRAA